MALELCFLYLIPYEDEQPAGPIVAAASPKDAPYFLELDIEFRSSWESRKVSVADTVATINLQILNQTAWVAECRYTIPGNLMDESTLQNSQIQAELRALIQRELNLPDGLSEQYTILLIQDCHENADTFIDHHAQPLAQIIRAFAKKVDAREAAETLASRIRFSENDLTVVDWSGAIIVAVDGDFQADIDLLKIGKFQLLRYRMLDNKVERMLKQIQTSIMGKRPGWLRAPHRTVQEIVNQRLTLLLDFERIDQSLLLIGDWYSAKLYSQINDNFGLKQWKSIVSSKLDNLEAIHSVVRENLSHSWRRTIDIIVFWGWIVLLIGYLFQFVTGLK